ncbi:MAG: STM4012 family radical SAM protein [Clostridiales bacterium]|nr:STM4012 family radical SAM protein [Clostridiales bacterium]
MNRYTQYMYSYPHKTAYRPLVGVNLKDHLSCLSGKGQSLYLHLPFCETKCGYCNLFSVTGQSPETIDRYLDSLRRQSRQYSSLLTDTVFSDLTIGGGTPLLLTLSQLEQMFSIVRENLTLDKEVQIVIETAPAQTTPEKLALLKEQRVTRVSMGIQSFSDQELLCLKRFHSAHQARRALDRLMDTGFPVVNLDFIYGIPGQTISSLLASLREAVSWKPEEIFLYPLYIKHGAGLERQLAQGMVLDQELAFLQYKEASAFLKSQGYRQDSMRRFIRQPSAREFSDCGASASLSLGCGGRSYLGRLHTCTPYAITRGSCLRELQRFMEETDYTQLRHGIFLSEDEQKRRHLIRNLLILPGISRKDYRKKFGREAEMDFPLLKKWVSEGYIQELGDFFSLTETGLGLSDYLGPQLISPAIQAAMKEWEERHGTC